VIPLANNKKISLLLSMLVMVVMMCSINVVAKAQGLIDPVINSIELSNKSLGKNCERNISMTASLEGGTLAETANIVYVFEGKQIGVTLNLVNGVYEGKIISDDSFSTGGWQISFVALEDTDGNAYSVCNSMLYGIGQDLSAGDFTYTWRDIDAPVFKAISVDKKNVDKKDSINLVVDGEDNYSGLAQEASVVYTLNTGKEVIEKAVTLTWDGAKYIGKIDTDTQSIAGLYQVKSVTLTDIAGNVTTINSKVNQEIGQDLSAGDYTVNENIVPNAIQVQVKTCNIKANQGNVTILVTNNGKENTPATLIIALFDKDGKFMNYITIARVIKAGESTELSGMLNILPGGHVVKCMVWDSMDNMNSLSDVKEIPVD
jgi:hypothetical protein